MDYYKILEVEPEVSAAEIKKNYRRLSLKYHPDKNGGDDAEFKKINEAYQVLSDDNKRKIYDLKRNNPLFSGHGAGDLPDVSDFFKMFMGDNMAGFPGGEFSFGGMPGMSGMAGMAGMPGMPNIRIFHHGRRQPMIRKPPPITKTIIITLDQSFTGLEYPLEIERWIDDGGRKIIENEKIYIPIPKGIDNNEMLKIDDKGNVLNGIKGCLKIFIKVENHSEFRRAGMDLIYRKKLTLKEALIGFDFELTFLDGKAYTINNSNGKIISPGYQKIVLGMGMHRSEAKGNLIIVFDVEFPKKLNKMQKEQITKIL